MTQYPEHFADNLTGRQAEILAFVRAYLATSGIPPTRAEIQQHFGFGSINAAVQHLRALEHKGAIKIVPGASRGIVVVGPVHVQQAVDDLATMRARVVVEALADLDKSCSKCDFDEAEGDIIRHCDACCRRIVAALGKVRRQSYQHLVRARSDGRKQVQRSRSYSRTYRGGTLGS